MGRGPTECADRTSGGSRYDRAIAVGSLKVDSGSMKKRIVVAGLWFYATLYAWSMLATFIGVPWPAGPVVAATVAALIAGDPMHRIWRRAAGHDGSAEVVTARVGELA